MWSARRFGHPGHPLSTPIIDNDKHFDWQPRFTGHSVVSPAPNKIQNSSWYIGLVSPTL